MFAAKIIALTFLATAQTRSIQLQDPRIQPIYLTYLIDIANKAQDEFEDLRKISESTFESAHPVYLNRVRRQLSTNPDGSANYNLKVPLIKGESNVLSVLGSASGIESAEGSKAAGMKTGPGYSAVGGGLAWDNINGHGLSVTGQHDPGHWNQMTVAGKLGLLNTENHKLDANAFVTKTMPINPSVPNFKTVGGSLDYTFRNKVGGSLGMSHTDLFRKTDYSAMGKLNLFRNPSSSLDLNAGFSKSLSSIPEYNHNWRPQIGFSFSKSF